MENHTFSSDDDLGEALYFVDESGSGADKDIKVGSGIVTLRSSFTPNNLAANQQYDVTAQLNDGVRFLQAQIQWPTGGSEPHFCHTECDILDAGPITDWLSQVASWVATHPYDVVTILLGNGN